MLGYHGSSIATPWTPPDPYTGKEHPINQILESLLPKPQGSQTPNAKAVVSTLLTSRWPSIPDAELMEEIGKRIANATTQYVEDPSRTHVPAGVPQPQRTDLEEKVAGMPVPFIEIRFQPG